MTMNVETMTVAIMAVKIYLVDTDVCVHLASGNIITGTTA